MFEAQQPCLAQLIDHKFTDVIDLSFLSDNPVDYIVVGYFISSLLSSSTPDIKKVYIQLKIDDNVSKYGLKLLLSQHSWCSTGRCIQVHLPKPSITTEGVQLMASHLEKSPSAINDELSIVAVDDFQRCEYGLLYCDISKALQSNCHHTKLHIIDLICISKYDLVLTKILCVNKTLKHLHLSSIGLSDSGAQYIFRALQQNTTLVYLNLASNGITGYKDTAQALNKLQVNKTLTHLNLSYNKLSNLGAHRCIFQGLQQNITLVHLNLASNGIRVCEDTSRALTTMFQINKALYAP